MTALGFDSAHAIVAKITVPDIPLGLIFDEAQSNTASEMFSVGNESIKEWFRALVNPLQLEFTHSTVADDNRPDANTRLLLETPDGTRRAIISGRPDFLICDGNSTLADYLFKIHCIVEIQSSLDLEACELQMMTYLYIFMNRQGFDKVIGFLVQLDVHIGTYEENETF
eukprot:gene15361-20702_t